ncbi:ABC transporter permease [Acetobacteraceae bacterium]|nr:ABC transporter permease [Acetobacteraceae bacterium]
MVLEPVQHLGRSFLGCCQGTGKLTFFALEAIFGLFHLPFYGKIFFATLLEIAFLSLPVIALTSIFAGGVIALQSWIGFHQYHAENALAGTVMIAVTRELGPVLTGLMVAGRVGAALAANIGAMRVTDQISALRSLAIDPIRMQVSPRLLAGLVALPILVMLSDILGIFGGFAVCVGKLGFSAVPYIHSSLESLKVNDISVGLAKAAVFGFMVTLFACYYGYKCRGGAEGVARAATATVVASSIMILITDYFLTDLLFAG